MQTATLPLSRTGDELLKSKPLWNESWLSFSSPSTPAPPQLELDSVDLVPFSKSFSGLFENEDSFCMKFLESSQSLEISNILRSLSNYPEESFDIENITNIKEFLPEWEDDDVDEILVLSHRRKPNKGVKVLESESEAEQHNTTIEDFEFVHPVDESERVFVARKKGCGTNKLYAIKTIIVWAEEKPNAHNARPELSAFKEIKRTQSPFLPELLWTFRSESSLYLVMDYYLGGNLFELVSDLGALATSHAKFYATEIAEGIDALHSVGIIHRDLNAKNVVLRENGHIVIVGFAYCNLKISDIRETRESRLIIGTPKEVQAPETILGWSEDEAVDCWSFGVLLYYLLFGENPFNKGPEGPSSSGSSQLSSSLADPFVSPETMDGVTRDLIRVCLERNPALRSTIKAIKSHEYFSDIDWSWVRLAFGKTPHVPKPKAFQLIPSVGLKGLGLSQNYSKLEKLDCSEIRSLKMPSNEERMLNTKASCRTLPAKFRDGELSGKCQRWAESVGRQAETEIGRISKQERMALFWESLDNDHDSFSTGPSVDFIGALSLPVYRRAGVKVQKSLAGPKLLLDKMSKGPDKVRNKLRKKSCASLRLPSSAPTELPDRVKQIESGIGYRCGDPSTTQSKASILAPRKSKFLGLTIPKMTIPKMPRLNRNSTKPRVEGISDAIPDVFGSCRSLGGLVSPTIMTAVSPTVYDNSPMTMIDGVWMTPPYSGTLGFGCPARLGPVEVKEGDVDATLRLVTPRMTERQISNFSSLSGLRRGFCSGR